MNFAKMAATNFKVQLGGEECEAAPLNLYDLSKIEEWGRTQTVKAAVEAIKLVPDLSDDDKSLVLDKAFHVAQLLSFVDIDEDDDAADNPMQSLMSSVGGIIHLVYCSLVKCNELTIEQLGMLKQDDLQEVAGQIMIRSGFAKEDTADANTKSSEVVLPEIPEA